MASAGVSDTVAVDDQRSYIKTVTLRDKTPTGIHIALREVCGEQTVQFSILLLVFVKDVSLLAITQRQEGRKHQQMKEV
jgi:hypothetical protein